MPEPQTDEPAPPTLQELRCRQIVETYLVIADALAARGRTVPPDTVAKLCGLALRLVMAPP
jgi:hypothetical protein